MKATGILVRLSVAALLFSSNGHLFGAYPRRHHPPVQPAGAGAVPAAPVKDPNLKKFKELPLNTVFCYPTDKVHEWFPRMKISATQAKTLATPGNPVESVSPVPQEIIVYMMKDKPLGH